MQKASFFLLGLVLFLLGCVAAPAPGPAGATLRLAHGITVALPEQFAFNGRLQDGTVATRKPEPAKVDPALPMLADLQNLQRAAPGIGHDRPSGSMLLSARVQDGEYHADINVEIAWLDVKRGVAEMTTCISDQQRLAGFARDQEARMQKRNEYIAFMDTIGIHGWKINNGYPVIDHEFHSKRGNMGSFDTDYIYNRTIYIFREDGTIVVSIDLPVSRLKTWTHRIDAMVKSLDVGAPKSAQQSEGRRFGQS